MANNPFVLCLLLPTLISSLYLVQAQTLFNVNSTNSITTFGNSSTPGGPGASLKWSLSPSNSSAAELAMEGSFQRGVGCQIRLVTSPNLFTQVWNSPCARVEPSNGSRNYTCQVHLTSDALELQSGNNSVLWSTASETSGKNIRVAFASDGEFLSNNTRSLISILLQDGNNKTVWTSSNTPSSKSCLEEFSSSSLFRASMGPVLLLPLLAIF